MTTPDPILTAGRVYRVSPVCAERGHLMDDGSLPTCMRRDCDEGLQEIDLYLDMEARGCRCDVDRAACPWHKDEHGE